ncbi:MAG: GNAT family N-acetyltransferase [Chloroflexia bacterium]|nr:GNAT family N-acetyltransferase [Chloroflexia bacterium]
MTELELHDVTIQGPRLTLRPLREADWPLLLRWNSDPEVLYYTEGDEVSAYSLEEIQAIYRQVSQSAFCFIIELGGRPIGEGWLQRMNLERILRAYPDQDCRRIDLLIGEKDCWGRGLGTEAIRLLTAFAFEREGADVVWACDVADYNLASRRAFQKAGYAVVNEIEQPPGSKAHICCDLALRREAYMGRKITIELPRK